MCERERVWVRERREEEDGVCVRVREIKKNEMVCACVKERSRETER